MEDFKGTKGKWKIGLSKNNGEPTYLSVFPESAKVGEVGKLICLVSQEDKINDYDEANAQLIATAPELLEVLSKLLSSYKELEDTMYGQGLTVNNWHQNGDVESVDNFFDENINPLLIEEAEKVIAKALGKEADSE